MEKNGFTETKRMREFSGMVETCLLSILFFPFNLHCRHSFIHSSSWKKLMIILAEMILSCSFTLYRKKLSHNLLNLKQILATQQTTTHKSDLV